MQSSQVQSSENSVIKTTSRRLFSDFFSSVMKFLLFFLSHENKFIGEAEVRLAEEQMKILNESASPATKNAFHVFPKFVGTSHTVLLQILDWLEDHAHLCCHFFKKAIHLFLK